MEKKKDSVLVLSMQDPKAKTISKVLAQESAKKILEKLQEKPFTETDLSKILNMPLPTIHHYVQLLLKSELIEWTHYHYSEKGKEVKHYKAKNMYVLVVPSNVSSASFIEYIKQFSFAYLFVIFGALYLWYSESISSQTSQVLTEQAPAGLMMAKSAAYDSSMMVVSETTAQTTQIPSFIWFLIGAGGVLLLYHLVLWVRSILKK
jgi:hypothetical protein